MVKECPMCGEIMRLKEREVVDRLPGTAQTRSTKIREWVCPECDYFEEANGGGAG
jgi:transposase